jgi:hypothetical protein
MFTTAITLALLLLPIAAIVIALQASLLLNWINSRLEL